MGYGAIADGRETTAVGNFAQASGWRATAFGAGASAGFFGTAIGSAAQAADVSTAVGQGTIAEIAGAGFGVQAKAGEYGTALGNNAATGLNGVAVGFNALAGQDAASVSAGRFTTAIGSEAWATEDGATVVGYNSYAQASNATVLGSNTWTTKDAGNSVALGAGSLADRANTVSVGAAQEWVDAAGVTHSAINRQLTNVAAGTQATDAVNKGQLDAVAATADAVGQRFKANGSGTASATGADAVAIGGNANASGSRSNALGSGATAIGNAALALGANSGASGNNSVALGAGSRALEANVVSVGGGNGTAGPATRRIVNVADGASRPAVPMRSPVPSSMSPTSASAPWKPGSVISTRASPRSRPRRPVRSAMTMPAVSA